MREPADRTPAWRRYLHFWRSDPKRDVDEELRFHLESAVEELVAAGRSRDAAEADVARRFGDVSTVSHTLYDLSLERERTMRRTEWLDTIVQDVRYGVRQLRKAPGFALIAILTLGIGIGANSAIFSVVYSVLLHPLPYARADRVLVLWERIGHDHMNVTYGNFDVWRREATDFEVLGATRYATPLALTGYGDPTPIPQIRASAGYWKAMYIPPVAGSYYGDAEDREGGPRVVVLSYALWQNRFGADRGIIGRVLTLSGVPFTVAAVAPPGYVVSPPAERVWTPLRPAASQLADHADHELTVYGLLRAGVDPATAVARLTQIETRLAKQYPNSYFDGGIIAKPVIDDLVGDTRFLLYVLLGAVGLVLLIACGNVANLLVARATMRRPEIAIRGALGASRARIVSQLLVESALLSLAGAVVGLGIAVAGIRFLISSPLPIARLENTTLNGPVLAFTLLVAIACAVVFGLVPALRAARLDLQQTLRDGGRESRPVVRERLRSALIVGELCLAQVLLVSAGLLIRSAMLVSAVPPGFDVHNLLVTNLNLPGARYPNQARQDAGFEQIQSAIEAVPGVRAVTRTQVAPIYSGGWDGPAFREGSNGHDEGAVVADMRAISPGYFGVLGARARGREFSRADGAGAPRVAIVSRGLATRLFGDADPIGKRIGNGSASKDPGWREIVGVVDDIRANGLEAEPPYELYMPNAQFVNGGQTFLIRGAVPVTTLVSAIRRAVASVDPLLALSGVSTMEEAIGQHFALPRFTTWLLSLLGATGLVLAVVGVYGLISYFVSQRTHEFGVRMALGADVPAVRRMVVRQGMVLGAIGVGVGVAASLAAARALRTLLFQVTTYDPITYVAVAALLLAVGVVASYLPARRATRIDPLEALRGG